MNRSTTVPVLIASLLFAVTAWADLIGDTIHSTTSSLWDADAVVVDPGREFTFDGGSIIFADFDGDDTLTVGAENIRGANGINFGDAGQVFGFTGLDWDTPRVITGMTLISNDFSGTWDTATTADSILIDTGFTEAVWPGPNTILSAVWHIDTVPIPAPSAFILGTLGFPMLSWARKRVCEP